MVEAVFAPAKHFLQLRAYKEHIAISFFNCLNGFMDTMQPMGCLLPLEAGVISRGVASLLKLLFILGGGAEYPRKCLYQSCFLKCIDLACNVVYSIALMDFLTAIWLLRSL